MVIVVDGACPVDRCELRRGGVDGDSPVEDIFYSATSGEDVMMEEQFEALLKEWGYNRCGKRQR